MINLNDHLSNKLGFLVLVAFNEAFRFQFRIHTICICVVELMVWLYISFMAITNWKIIPFFFRIEWNSVWINHNDHWIWNINRSFDDYLCLLSSKQIVELQHQIVQHKNINTVEKSYRIPHRNDTKFKHTEKVSMT